MRYTQYAQSMGVRKALSRFFSPSDKPESQDRRIATNLSAGATAREPLRQAVNVPARSANAAGCVACDEFATWHTYDPEGQPIWFVLDSGARSTEAGFAGLRAALAGAEGVGGTFGGPETSELLPAGRMTLDCSGCTTAIAHHDVHRVVGRMNLLTVLPVENCRD